MHLGPKAISLSSSNQRRSEENGKTMSTLREIHCVHSSNMLTTVLLSSHSNPPVKIIRRRSPEISIYLSPSNAYVRSWLRANNMLIMNNLLIRNALFHEPVSLFWCRERIISLGVFEVQIWRRGVRQIRLRLFCQCVFGLLYWLSGI